MSSAFWHPIRFLPALLVVAACTDSEEEFLPEPHPDGCDPPAILPNNFRPIAKKSEGLVEVTTAGGVTSGSIDARAGGFMVAADNPYIYVDLRSGIKVEIDDLEAFESGAWDIALKRANLRVNGGDSGPGRREISVVQAESLDAVTSAPTTGYSADDFTATDCTLQTTEVGEPMSAIGEWYGYDLETHNLVPKPEVYVIQRRNGTRTALRLIDYYGGNPDSPRSAFYILEWKQLK